MTTKANQADNEAQIRQVMEDLASAVRSKDVDSAMSYYAPDIASFDVVGPLQKNGLDERRKRTEDWFSSFVGPIGFEMRDLRVTAGDDVAFCHSLNQVKATKQSGGELAMWWRATACFQRVDGKWRMTHEHGSVPFEPMTGKASLSLTP